MKPIVFISRGFTLIEMVMVILIMAILSAVAMPAISTFFAPSLDASRQTVLAALRQARGTSYAHRRLVCVTVVSASLVEVQASANPSASCAGTSLLSPAGQSNFLQGIKNLTLSSSPQAILYFQPDGRVTSDVIGATPSDYTLTMTIAGQGSAAVTLSGASGSAQ